MNGHITRLSKICAPLYRGCINRTLIQRRLRMPENRNFLLAIILSLAVLLGWQFLVIEPRMKERAQRAPQTDTSTDTARNIGRPALSLPQPNATSQPSLGDTMSPVATSRVDIKNTPRLHIRTEQFEGTIAPTGARLDDLALRQYPASLDADAAPVRLFGWENSATHWQASFGWVGDDTNTHTLPDADTLWEVIGNRTLTPETPVTLVHQTRKGLRMTRTISVDENFMFTIDSRVANMSGHDVTLYPYGQLTRTGRPEVSQLFILHEGAIGFIGEEGLQELDYDDLVEGSAYKAQAQSGWIGFTDKYWASILIPPSGETFTARFIGTAAPRIEDEVYRSDYLLEGRLIPAGGSTHIQVRLFAGAKRVRVIDQYANSGIDRFDLLIDWGWFYFLTKPMFYALEFFYELIGNYGLAILLVTVIIKIFFFPLANRSYETMAKMKKLQPKMSELRETYKDDRQMQQQELMRLYREEKLNPLAGCLPVLLQIPVFFAVYKVLFVTIDMRHQPFFGWIRDLSAADPTSLFNLFGLIAWQPPEFLMLGVWPLVMGLTMFMQMQMNPAPPDPIQAMIFRWMPIFFTFILASFPAGLVIYWAWNNFLSILQQGVIMRRNGVAIELLANLGIKKRGKDGG